MVPIRVYQLGLGVHHQPRLGQPFKQHHEAVHSIGKLCRFGSLFRTYGVAHGRWSVPVVNRGMDTAGAEARQVEGHRLSIDRRCLSVQAKLFAHSSIFHTSSGRLAREEVLDNHNSARGWLLRLSVGYRIFLGSRCTTDFAVRLSLYGCRELPEFRVLARDFGGILRDVSVKGKGCATATYQTRTEVRWSIDTGSNTGDFNSDRTVPGESRRGVFRRCWDGTRRSTVPRLGGNRAR